MDASKFIPILFTCLLFSHGCGKQDAYLSQYVEILHGDVRALKDHIYDLEYENEILLAELDELQQDEKAASNSSTQPSNNKPAQGGNGNPDELDESPIDIDYGDPQPPGSELPLPGLQGHELPEPRDNVANEKESSQPLRVSHRDDRATHLVIAPLTGGWNFDERSGDDGILLVIEPRNAKDEFVPQPGAVTAVLLDPAESGEKARFAKWEITSERAEESLSVSSRNRGIRLKLPWPDRAPKHSRVHLFVRFKTAEGLELEADREILVSRPGQFSQRWTPRSGEFNEIQAADKSSSNR